jgi:serine/threonine protein phosphatase PrpC
VKEGRPDYTTRTEEARRGHGEDRCAVVQLPDRTILVVADGAGGVIAGATAAEAVCEAVVDRCKRGVPPSWSGWLSQLDRSMPRAGLAAAAIVEVRNGGHIVGASAGDCEAWLFAHGLANDLTSKQIRKPLLGEGKSVPTAFEADAADAVILVATDGLWKCANRTRIARATAVRPLEAAAKALVDAARLKSGALQDDIGLVICEIKNMSARRSPLDP